MGALLSSPAFWGAVGTIGSSLLNQFSGERQMDFQRDMSNTAYSRSVRDMRNAGLNPVLALGNPASTPPGASASFPDLGATFINSARAAQDISESRTREPLHRANAEASLASAKAAEEEAKLKAEIARRTREMLPYEMTESGVRIRSGIEGAEGQELDNILKGLSVDQQRVVKSVFQELGPFVIDFLKSTREVTNSAKDAWKAWDGTLKSDGFETNDAGEYAKRILLQTLKANPVTKGASELIEFLERKLNSPSSEDAIERALRTRNRTK